MTIGQYHFVNRVRLSNGFPALLRCAPDHGLGHQAKQVRRALLRCSPVRKVRVTTAGAFVHETQDTAFYYAFAEHGNNPTFIPAC